MDDDVAWTQLAGGLLLPGGAWGGVGVGAFILHRFGMPNKLIAEREFNLSFLNTAVDAIVLIVVGVGLAIGVFSGEHHLLLTVLPAALAATGIALALLIAHRISSHAARLESKHPKIAGAITTLGDAVNDTEQLLVHRGARASLLGVLIYFGLDVVVLWTAFLAIHAHPSPSFAIVVMAYIIGALGGSIPLPASAGTVGGMGGMLILYGVGHNVAIAAVLLHQAIGLLVPIGWRRDRLRDSSTSLWADYSPELDWGLGRTSALSCDVSPCNTGGVRRLGLSRLFRERSGETITRSGTAKRRTILTLVGGGTLTA